jgi:choline kinase
MSTRSAIILAAGHAKRLGPLAMGLPKALLEIDGATLVDRQLDALMAFGIDAVTVVVGYRQQALRDHLGDRVRFIENPRYAETNSLYSLWLARDELRDGGLVLNADVFVSPELLEPLVEAAAPDAALVNLAATLGEEEMKVRLWEGFVVDFGKEITPDDADGENVGVLKFGTEGGQRLVRQLDAHVQRGMVRAWAPHAFRDLAREWPLRSIETASIPWIEIDFPDDLERARTVVAPALTALRQDNSD